MCVSQKHTLRVGQAVKMKTIDAREKATVNEINHTKTVMLWCIFSCV